MMHSALARAAVLFGATASLLACKNGPATSGDNRDLSQFECKGRRVEYMVAGGFVADEAGVSVLCDNENPRLIKWRVDSDKRSESVHKLSGEQFDELWEKVDATGWRYLDSECDNPDAAPDDPAYVIDLSDFTGSVTLSCSGKELPFHYEGIVSELDLRAAGFGDQHGAAP